MLLSKIEHPISILNISTFGISISEVQELLGKNYINYGADNYLVQHNKINLIKSSMPKEKKIDISNEIWLGIYQNMINDNEILSLFPFIEENIFNKIQQIKPTRKRCISEYNLEFSKNKWHAERLSHRPFSQKLSANSANQNLDYRLTDRLFKELPQDLFDDNLNKMFIMAADEIRFAKPDVKRLNIIVHHTLILCSHTQAGDNSPEGIHQDGADFIISALCIDRNNINGGKSIVYGADKITPIFEIELQAGQGLFQPDAGTDLWHKVTPITVKNNTESGYRSTIGFDISVII